MNSVLRDAVQVNISCVSNHIFMVDSLDFRLRIFQAYILQAVELQLPYKKPCGHWHEQVMKFGFTTTQN